MEKSLWGPLLGVVIALGAFWFFQSKAYSKILLKTDRTKTAFLKTQIGEGTFFVEIANTPQKRTLGLSYRAQLDHDRGMLFIFDKAGPYSFWMKGMNFPLDFVWLSGETIIDVTENVPPPCGKNILTKCIQMLRTVTANKPFNQVLELNGGMVKKYHITPGEQIRFLKD